MAVVIFKQQRTDCTVDSHKRNYIYKIYIFFNILYTSLSVQSALNMNRCIEVNHNTQQMHKLNALAKLNAWPYRRFLWKNTLKSMFYWTRHSVLICHFLLLILSGYLLPLIWLWCCVHSCHDQPCVRASTVRADAQHAQHNAFIFTIKALLMGFPIFSRLNKEKLFCL